MLRLAEACAQQGLTQWLRWDLGIYRLQLYVLVREAEMWC